MKKSYQKQSFGVFKGVPSDDQLRLYFQLTDFDREFIDEMRSDTTQLGIAVQLGSVRFLGTFPTDMSQIPVEVVTYVANQLNIDVTAFKGYTRKMTITQHANFIRMRYQFQNFGESDVKAKLREWLLDRARFTTETKKMLFDMLLKKCLDEKIILPGITTFIEFINQVVVQASAEVAGKLAAIPSKQEQQRLLNLLTAVDEPSYGATIKMDLLRNGLIDESQKEIQRGFKRLKQFQRFKTEEWDLSAIPAGKLKNMANFAFKAKANYISRLSKDQQLSLLVAFVAEYSKRAMDEQLLALSRFYEITFNRAKNKESKERLRTIRDLDRAASTLSGIVEIFLDETIRDQDVRAKVLAQYSPASIQSAVVQVNHLTHNEHEPIAIEELLNSYRKFRKFIPDILATIEFEGTSRGEAALTVWNLIDRQYPGVISYRMYKGIETNLPKKWRFYVQEHPQYVNQCVVIGGIELLIHALKRHDIYVNQSNRYIDPLTNLIDEATWHQQKDILIKQLSLPQTGDVAVKTITRDLELSYKETLKNWSKSEMAEITNVDGHEKIIVTKLHKVRQQKNEIEFKNRVRQLIPKIDLPDLLLEVNQQLALTTCFTHPNDVDVKMRHLDISILAVLLAEACNIGFSPVSKEGAASLKYDRLVYVDHQYLRIDTLSAANKRIINAHRKLKGALSWGDSQMASADGIRYVTPQKSLYSRSNPRYFGRGRGITFYNFVSDQYIGFHGMVVAGTLRDSLYLLEGFLNQTSGLEPTQIMTDTAGYSDLIFGLFGLLGFQFSPRIATGQNTKLWRIDTNANYRRLNGVSQNRINVKLIEENWDDILRVAGSLKSGQVNATELTQALQREGHPTTLGKAITEYGKVYKTKHQLRYLSDETYARQILEQLNKGEARHSLCRNIFYGRKGKLYQTYFDGMEEQLNALSLVTNAIIYWNTLYLEKILAQMRIEGFNCTEELISKLSPLMSEHINFVGKYTFQYDEALKNGRLRPLDESNE